MEATFRILVPAALGACLLAMPQQGVPGPERADEAPQPAPAA